MKITVEIKNCMACRHVDHSGSFTVRGARQICGHSDSCKARKTHEQFKREYPEYAGRGYSRQDWKYHWYHRTVDDSGKVEIPSWCPLLNGSNY
jgi:hypothetical protein